MMIQEDQLINVDKPLLNRFEKYYVSLDKILSPENQQLIFEIDKEIEKFWID